MTALAVGFRACSGPAGVQFDVRQVALAVIPTITAATTIVYSQVLFRLARQTQPEVK